jgi:hypothetical protein
MTTPAGQIAMSDVNVELAYAWNRVNSSLNDGTVRVLAQVPSGQISMANLRSKTNTFNLTIGDAQNGDLRAIANANGYQNQPKVYLILVGTMYSYATGTAACYVGGWPAGTQLTVELRGTIQAYGGAGGGGGGAGGGGAAGGAGGYALYFNAGIPGGSITFYINGGWVYGGGGGGGGGGSGRYTTGGGGDAGYQCWWHTGGAGGHGQGWAWGQGAGASGVLNSGAATASGTGGWGGGWGAAGAGGGAGANAAPCGNGLGGGGGGAPGYAYLGWGNVSSYVGNTGNYSGSVG